MFNAVNFSLPFNPPTGAANNTVSETLIATFLCPADPTVNQIDQNNRREGNYVVNWGNSNWNQNMNRRVQPVRGQSPGPPSNPGPLPGRPVHDGQGVSASRTSPTARATPC